MYSVSKILPGSFANFTRFKIFDIHNVNKTLHFKEFFIENRWEVSTFKPSHALKLKKM